MSANKIFNRDILKSHRDKASKHIEHHDFLFKNSAEDIIDRVLFYQKSYNDVLDLGCRIGYFNDIAQNEIKFQNLYQTDLSIKMLDKVDGIKIQCDEESLPFAKESFDLVISNLNLHWINNFYITLEQIKKTLKPKGRFVASIIGGRSLRSLRELLIKAEMQLGANIGFHISPMITSESMVQLMQKADFKDIVVDSNIVTVNYKNIFILFKDLQNMGESNAMYGKIKYLRKDILGYLYNNIQEFYCDFEIITVSAVK